MKNRICHNMLSILNGFLKNSECVINTAYQFNNQWNAWIVKDVYMYSENHVYPIYCLLKVTYTHKQHLSFWKHHEHISKDNNIYQSFLWQHGNQYYIESAKNHAFGWESLKHLFYHRSYNNWPPPTVPKPNKPIFTTVTMILKTNNAEDIPHS